MLGAGVGAGPDSVLDRMVACTGCRSVVTLAFGSMFHPADIMPPSSSRGSPPRDGVNRSVFEVLDLCPGSPLDREHQSSRSSGRQLFSQGLGMTRQNTIVPKFDELEYRPMLNSRGDPGSVKKIPRANRSATTMRARMQVGHAFGACRGVRNLGRIERQGIELAQIFTCREMNCDNLDKFSRAVSKL